MPNKTPFSGIATAAGVHCKKDPRFNLSGDFTFREVPDDTPTSELMVSHGGYGSSDVNKDINCMFPIEPLHLLAKNGVIGSVSEVHIGFMGGGGNQEKFKNETGTPRAVAPLVPMGANAGEPHNIDMQYGIVKEALEQLEILESPGQVVPLDYEYVAKV